VVTNYPGNGIVQPEDITAGPDGNLWFGNGDDTAGRITPSGKVTDFHARGIDIPAGLAAGADGALWFTNFGDNSLGRISTP
jgi:virginiamycin B lyase